MREEIEKRVTLLSKAKDNPQLQAIEIELCKRDIMYWFNNYVYTEKNKTFFEDDVPTIVPFIPFEYQVECIEEIWESIIEGNKPVHSRKQGVLTNVFIEKSRQMGISWLVCAIFVYGFVFHQHKYTMISRTQEEVDVTGDMDSLFEKLRFILRNLPTWMLPKGFNKEVGKDKSNSFMRITDPNSTASITGKTANPDAGRGGTRNAVFMDEMASMQYAEAIVKSLGSATSCTIYNSTPKGEGNEYYRIRQKTMRRVINGVTYEPEVKGLRYHWSEHPHYTQEWYDQKINGMSKEQIAQELEIDYNTALVGRVYAEFPKNPDPFVKYDPYAPMYVWMDNSHGGSDPTAVLIVQPEGPYFNVVDCVEIFEPSEYCAEYLSLQPRFQMNHLQVEFLARYRNYNRKRAIFISDPYDSNSRQSAQTICEMYRKNGIEITRPSLRDKTAQIEKTRSNIYRIRYGENCSPFASAIMNARYPERKEGSNSTSEIKSPVHDWTSHYRTAMEYGINYVLERGIVESKKKTEDKRQKRDMVTGRLV